jgi:hypothetical protein
MVSDQVGRGQEARILLREAWRFVQNAIKEFDIKHPHVVKGSVEAQERWNLTLLAGKMKPSIEKMQRVQLAGALTRASGSTDYPYSQLRYPNPNRSSKVPEKLRELYAAVAAQLKEGEGSWIDVDKAKADSAFKLIKNKYTFTPSPEVVFDRRPGKEFDAWKNREKIKNALSVIRSESDKMRGKLKKSSGERLITERKSEPNAPSGLWRRLFG